MRSFEQVVGVYFQWQNATAVLYRKWYSHRTTVFTILSGIASEYSQLLFHAFLLRCRGQPFFGRVALLIQTFVDGILFLLLLCEAELAICSS
jgi:hypothetical protein